MRGVILGDTRGAGLAIESDISIADFPTATSCLANLQLVPNEFNNGLQVVAENIDSWRTNLITRIKLYTVLLLLIFKLLLMPPLMLAILTLKQILLSRLD